MVPADAVTALSSRSTFTTPARTTSILPALSKWRGIAPPGASSTYASALVSEPVSALTAYVNRARSDSSAFDQISTRSSSASSSGLLATALIPFLLCVLQQDAPTVRRRHARLLPARTEIALACGDSVVAREAAAELVAIGERFGTPALRAAVLAA